MRYVSDNAFQINEDGLFFNLEKEKEKNESIGSDKNCCYCTSFLRVRNIPGRLVTRMKNSQRRNIAFPALRQFVYIIHANVLDKLRLLEIDSV